jgi:hypothetical protein
MIVTLVAGPKMNFVTEPAAKWQSHTSAIRAVLKNLDTDDFPVSLDLPFYEFEWHDLILPRSQFVRKVFFTGIADDNHDLDTIQIRFVGIEPLANIRLEFMASGTALASLRLFHLNLSIASGTRRTAQFPNHRYFILTCLFLQA